VPGIVLTHAISGCQSLVYPITVFLLPQVMGSHDTYAVVPFGTRCGTGPFRTQYVPPPASFQLWLAAGLSAARALHAGGEGARVGLTGFHWNGCWPLRQPARSRVAVADRVDPADRGADSTTPRCGVQQRPPRRPENRVRRKPWRGACGVAQAQPQRSIGQRVERFFANKTVFRLPFFCCRHSVIRRATDFWRRCCSAADQASWRKKSALRRIMNRRDRGITHADKCHRLCRAAITGFILPLGQAPYPRDPACEAAVAPSLNEPRPKPVTPPVPPAASCCMRTIACPARERRAYPYPAGTKSLPELQAKVLHWQRICA